jgi:hypothetical protein
VAFAEVPSADGWRLLVEEYEYISANYTDSDRRAPGRLIYAETFLVDAALVGQ